MNEEERKEMWMFFAVLSWIITGLLIASWADAWMFGVIP